MNSNFNIILCGFMGCGKSSTGKELARIKKISHIDLDEYIENTENEKISQIFSKYGEDYFRDLEHEAVKKCLNKFPLVISCGGGTPLYKRNLNILKKKGKIIFIDTKLSEIKRRLTDLNNRPLLIKQDIDLLYKKRKGVYEKIADIIVDGNKPVNEVCYEIMERINV